MNIVIRVMSSYGMPVLQLTFTSSEPQSHSGKIFTASQVLTRKSSNLLIFSVLLVVLIYVHGSF